MNRNELDSCDGAAVEDAETISGVVECERHWELALGRDGIAEWGYIGRHFRVDGEQRNSVRTGLEAGRERHGGRVRMRSCTHVHCSKNLALSGCLDSALQYP